MQLVNCYVDALKRYFDFKGQADRPAYWWFVLATFIVSLVIGLFSLNLQYIYALATLIPSLAITARRIRNTGHSAWHTLWYLLPGLGWIIVLIFTLLPTKGRK